MKTNEKTVQHNGKTVQETFSSFIEFERAWHEWVNKWVITNDNGYQRDYNRGKLDHIPYNLWDDNVTDWKTL